MLDAISVRKVRWVIFLASIAWLAGCKDVSSGPTEASLPQVEENGALIRLPPQADSNLFKAEEVRPGLLRIKVEAPSRVVVSVSRSDVDPKSPLLIFESPELTSLYSSFNQNKAAFEKSRRNFDRARDLFAHQAATGKDLEDAQNDLATASAAFKEFEGKLRALGFDPKEFQAAAPGVVWLISDVPETQIHDLQAGLKVSVEFTSYPGEDFQGKVEAIGDVVDAVTRTVKVRLSVPNRGGRLRPGMFATVRFGQEEKQVMCLPPAAVVAVQGHDYLFVRTAGGTFRRREVVLGRQSGDSVEIVQGLRSGEVVAVEGAMLLKGLSFGY